MIMFRGLASSISTQGLRAAVLVSGLLLMAGCSGDAVKTVSVEGTVTLDGKPLPNAEVEFQPTDNSSPSYGKTDSSGHYELMFTADQAGALVGEHKVRITTGGETEDDSGNTTTTEEVVPEKYNAQTELTATVEKGGGPYDFDLTTN
jgi:hypothetical protein